MNTVNGINPASYAAAAASAAGSAEAQSPLGKNEFLRLLVEQMKYQNPLEPVKSENFIAQLAQFSSLEQLQNMEAATTSLMSIMSADRAASLLGRLVRVEGSDGTVKEGRVLSVNLSSGSPVLVTEFGEVGMDEVVSIST